MSWIVCRYTVTLGIHGARFLWFNLPLLLNLPLCKLYNRAECISEKTLSASSNISVRLILYVCYLHGYKIKMTGKNCPNYTVKEENARAIRQKLEKKTGSCLILAKPVVHVR